MQCVILLSESTLGTIFIYLSQPRITAWRWELHHMDPFPPRFFFPPVWVSWTWKGAVCFSSLTPVCMRTLQSSCAETETHIWIELHISSVAFSHNRTQVTINTSEHQYFREDEVWICNEGHQHALQQCGLLYPSKVLGNQTHFSTSVIMRHMQHDVIYPSNTLLFQDQDSYPTNQVICFCCSCVLRNHRQPFSLLRALIQIMT